MKRIFIFGLILLWCMNVLAVPDNTMSITPAAVDATTIQSADVNSRSNTISTTYNAHSHTDKAATSLNNLSSVAISESLVSDTDNTDNLGSSTVGWASLFMSDAGVAPTTNGQISYVTANSRFELYQNGAVAVLGSSFAIGSFTRDTATASGTQAVTGVGFKPTHVRFTMGEHGATTRSWGLDDATNFEVIAFQADTSNMSISSTRSIYSIESGSVHYSGKITTLGSDGFTITWTKTGSPTGTITIDYFVSK